MELRAIVVKRGIVDLLGGDLRALVDSTEIAELSPAPGRARMTRRTSPALRGGFEPFYFGVDNVRESRGYFAVAGGRRDRR